MKNKKVYIIFLTGHLEYALLAYKYKTFDYLPKPIVKERLEETVVRLFHDIYNTPNQYIKIDNKSVIIRITIKKKIAVNWFWIHNIDEIKC